MSENEEMSTIKSTEVPYPPSWIDRFIGWIDRLPIPAWFFYVLSVVMYILVISIAFWIDRSVPIGKVGSIPGIFAPIVFSFLALYHYLTRISSRSLFAFRPLLEVDDAKLARINYELSTVPRKLDWLVVPVSLLIGYPFLVGTRPHGEIFFQIHSCLLQQHG